MSKLDERDVARLLGRLKKLRASNHDPSGKPDPAFASVLAGASFGTRDIGDTITLVIDGKRLPKLAAAVRKDVIEQLDHEGFLWLRSHKIGLSLYHLGKLRPWYCLRSKLDRTHAETLLRKLSIPFED